MTGIDSAHAVISSQRIASWDWDGEAGRLTIVTASSDTLSVLDGEWALSAFLEQIEGLTRGQLRQALASGDFRDSIDMRIHLHSGQAARLVGAFYDTGLARGLLLDEQGEIPALTIAQASGLTSVYQPIQCLRTGVLAGFEVLARWQNTDGGLRRPDQLCAGTQIVDFSAIAPKILEQAIGVFKGLPKRCPALFMQVNLSAVELGRADLVRELVEIARHYALPRHALRIELTEHAALRDRYLAHRALASLQAAGFGLVLDDFGAGHSSLIWLAELPAIGLKIDRKLAAAAKRPRAAIILQGMIDLAHRLELSVTAEGLEDREHARLLADMGCDYGQGYVFGHPLESGEILSLLDSGRF